MANELCYVEFYSSDFKGTGKFFSDVFGWQTTPSMNNYLSWSAGDSPLGGGFSSEGVDKQGPHTLAYIHVEDIEAALKAVNEHGGGTVLPKTKISDEYGFFAIFTEPGGTAVGLWSKS